MKAPIVNLRRACAKNIIHNILPVVVKVTGIVMLQHSRDGAPYHFFFTLRTAVGSTSVTNETTSLLLCRLAPKVFQHHQLQPPLVKTGVQSTTVRPLFCALRLVWPVAWNAKSFMERTASPDEAVMSKNKTVLANGGRPKREK